MRARLKAYARFLERQSMRKRRYARSVASLPARRRAQIVQVRRTCRLRSSKPATRKPVPRALPGEPGQNAEAPARPQGAEGLAEEALLVDHVLGALNCVYPVEDRVLEPVREPIPTRDGDPFMAGRGHAGPLSLNRRDGHARHEDAMP